MTAIRVACLGVTLIGLIGASREACADRVFYRAGTWLETSLGVQRLSLTGVLRGWERVAGEAEGAALAGQPVSWRQREAVRLTGCLTGATVAEVQERVTTFASIHADRIFYSLSDFIAESLQDRCVPP